MNERNGNYFGGNMIKIAVADDDLSIHEKMQLLLSRFEMNYDYDIQSEYFSSCEELADKINKGSRYDLIFLDIEFSGMNGTEFGTMLRRKMKNYVTQIVFISSVENHAMELFRIHPIEFLIKPIKEAEFRRCMLSYMDYYGCSDTFLEYTLDNIRHRIRSSEVLYLESNRKKAIFHTKRGEFSSYGKISDIIRDDKERFICISRGVYVNIDHIIDATAKVVRLTDDSGLYISRGCQSYVRDRLAGI